MVLCRFVRSNGFPNPKELLISVTARSSHAAFLVYGCRRFASPLYWSSVNEEWEVHFSPNSSRICACMGLAARFLKSFDESMEHSGSFFLQGHAWTTTSHLQSFVHAMRAASDRCSVLSSHKVPHLGVLFRSSEHFLRG